MASKEVRSRDKSEGPRSVRAAVRMRDIWKRFPGVIANRGIDLDFYYGEVHALLGENGAGKTTIMNILSGLYRPDSGGITVDGRTVNFRSPADAIAVGIGMVHQHFRLVENMTVAENIHLGWKETPARVSQAELSTRTRTICQHHGLRVDPEAKIWQLSVGEQQRVEILRVLARKAQVLILDEPTAVLTPREADELFEVMHSLAEEQKTVVFISHKLREVLEVTDRISVLREGVKVSTLDTSKADLRTLANLMIGKDVARDQEKGESARGEVILEVQNAHAESDRGLAALKGINLTLHKGEILGIAGVAGNGQTELAEVLTGMRSVKEGDVILDGQEVSGRSAAFMARAGVGHIPEDRSSMGLVTDLNVENNAILRNYRHPPISKGFIVDHQEANEFAKRLVQEANVIVPNVDVLVRHLSGGNQQRLLAGRETRIASKVLIAVHPTRGLDVGATAEVRQALIDHRDRGAGILLISEDLDELLQISDRIMVIYEGRIVGEFSRQDRDREQIGLLMGGHRLPEGQEW